MRHGLCTLALLPAIALASAAHATSFTASAALNDTTNNNDINFTLVPSPTPISFTATPGTSSSPISLTFQESSSVNGNGNVGETDDVALVISFTQPGTGNGGTSGTGTITGHEESATGTITWTGLDANFTTPVFTLSDGTRLSITLPSNTVTFATTNLGNGPENSGTVNITFNDLGSIATTPEPSSLALLGTGVLGVAGVLRRRMNA